MEIEKQIEELLPFMIKHRRELHKIPEIAWNELKTSAYIQSVLKEIGLEFETVKTGIIVKIAGRSPARTIGFRADIDGLQVEERHESEFKSQHDGYMHACGHDVHAAILLGFAKYLKGNPPTENIVLVWQPAEEGGGGAKAMTESELFKADVFYAVHVTPHLEVGKFSCRDGISQPGTRRIEINFQGISRHAQNRDGTQDALMLAAEFLLESEKLNTNDTLFHIGILNGGTGTNTIAAEAKAIATARWFQAPEYDNMMRRIEQISKLLEEKGRGTIVIRPYENICLPIQNTPQAVERIKNFEGHTVSNKDRILPLVQDQVEKYSQLIAATTI